MQQHLRHLLYSIFHEKGNPKMHSEKNSNENTTSSIFVCYVFLCQCNSMANLHEFIQPHSYDFGTICLDPRFRSFVRIHMNWGTQNIYNLGKIHTDQPPHKICTNCLEIRLEFYRNQELNAHQVLKQNCSLIFSMVQSLIII